MQHSWVVFFWAASAVAASPVDFAGFDRLFSERDEPRVLAQLERQAAELLIRFPDDGQVLWRVARAHCAMAKAQPAGPGRQAEALTCWTLGDRARALNPSSAEAHYWAAVGLGLWARSIGVLRAITEGVQEKLHERLDKAIALDPDVDHAGPWLIKGRFYQEAPWPLHDMKRAGEYLDKVRARFPESVKARLYYADWLVEQGERQKAQAELEALLAADGSYDLPDARAAKAEAAQTLEQLREARP
jgi:uncharacterized protein (TIGR02996 family)